MIIQKFGGTSLEDALALERVCGIVASARARCPVVVVSAIGETTDRLAEVLERAAAGEEDRALAGLSRLQRDTQRHLREFFGDGAAGASILNAELAVSKGLFS